MKEMVLPNGEYDDREFFRDSDGDETEFNEYAYGEIHMYT